MTWPAVTLFLGLLAFILGCGWVGSHASRPTDTTKLTKLISELGDLNQRVDRLTNELRADRTRDRE